MDYLKEIFDDCFDEKEIEDFYLEPFDNSQIAKLKNFLKVEGSFDKVKEDVFHIAKVCSFFNVFAQMSFFSSKKVKTRKLKDYSNIINNYEKFYNSIEKSMDRNLMPLFVDLKSKIEDKVEKLKDLKPIYFDYDQVTKGRVYRVCLESLVECFIFHRERKGEDFNEYVLDCAEFAYLVSDHIDNPHMALSTIDNEEHERPPTTEYWGALPKEVKKILNKVGSN